MMIPASGKDLYGEFVYMRTALTLVSHKWESLSTVERAFWEKCAVRMAAGGPLVTDPDKLFEAVRQQMDDRQQQRLYVLLYHSGCRVSKGP